MTERCMFRYVVPVDDRPHEVKLSRDPVAVAAAADSSVEFWAEHGEDDTARWFQVFGTGQPLPADAAWRGTCPRTQSGLVWHLYELPEETRP